MRISEIPHVDHGRIALCSCQNKFRIDESTVVEEFSLPDLPPPEFIGRYHIVRYLGRGATNCVYKGIHPELGIPVAVKTMLPEYAMDRPSCDQFFRAAKICTKAVHPNIVKIFETGRDANGVPFLAMEFLPGGTLADRILKDEIFSLKQTAEIGIAVCRALTETARLGIVHRDIKPDNIMISADGQYKLTDLGLAKVDTPSEPGSRTRILDENDPGRLTARKTSFGTLEYMSPEQCIDTESCDIRSDIYSLGITLYQLAAGRLPFEPLTRSELRHMHLSVEPLVPSTYRPDIPLDFDFIVLQCIQKRPEDRYQTPEELLADLEAFLAGMPLPSTTCGAVPFIHAKNALLGPEDSRRKSKLLPVVAAVLVFLILIGAGVLYLMKRPAGRQGRQRPKYKPVETLQETAPAGRPSSAGPAAVQPGHPSSKGLYEEPDIGISDTETNTLLYFDEAKKAAEKALEDGFGFAKAIDDLKNFSGPELNGDDRTANDERNDISVQDDYSRVAEMLIGKLNIASNAAVGKLIGELNEKARPFIRERKYQAAIVVYGTDIGNIAPESLKSREQIMDAIRSFEKAVTMADWAFANNYGFANAVKDLERFTAHAPGEDTGKKDEPGSGGEPAGSTGPDVGSGEAETSISDKENMTIPDEAKELLSDEAEEIIAKLKEASDAAVRDLIAILDKKAAPFKKDHKWTEAVEVYRSDADIEPLATESKAAREGRIREIELVYPTGAPESSASGTNTRENRP